MLERFKMKILYRALKISYHRIIINLMMTMIHQKYEK